MRKVVAGVVGVLVAIPLGLILAAVTLLPKEHAAPQLKVEANAARVARGEYLFNHVSGCADCHSPHDYSTLAGRLSGALGSGGLCLTEQDGFPGHVCAPNLTPDRTVGLGAWSDGEVVRAIREGVDRNGRWLVPVMPYEEFRAMSDEDVQSLVAYVRTLPTSGATVQARHISFPVNLLMRMAPRPVEAPVATPSASDPVAYGKYLTTIAGCVGCHTPREKGAPKPGMRFAGGEDMRGPWGRVITANITPDEKTGIGAMTQAQFIARFKAMAALPADTAAPEGANTVMPWRSFGGMTDADLAAIYAYLRTVPKVQHAVVTHPGLAQR